MADAFLKPKHPTVESALFAYNEYINSCLAAGKCTRDKKDERAKMLYAVYHNVGDSLVRRDGSANLASAIEYYNAALKSCLDAGQTEHTCRKLAETYYQLELLK